jgi:hypothetical protein
MKPEAGEKTITFTKLDSYAVNNEGYVLIIHI